MSHPLPAELQRPAYLASLLLAAMAVRGFVGGFRPELGLWASAWVGLFTVVCLGPSLHRTCYGLELLDTPGKQRRHLAAMALAATLFWQAVC